MSQKNLLAITSTNNSKSKSLVNVVTNSQQPATSTSQQSSAQSGQVQQSTQPTSSNTSQQLKQQVSQLPQLPAATQLMDKNEKLLLKKYARYSKQSPKSVSAVLRQPTLTNNSGSGGGGNNSKSGGTTGNHRRYQSTINKQTSLSQLVLSKFYVNSSAGNVSKMSSNTGKCMSAVDEAGNSMVAQSQNDSLDTPTQDNLPSHMSSKSHANTSNVAGNNESFSVVSSKISLFKKTV